MCSAAQNRFDPCTRLVQRDVRALVVAVAHAVPKVLYELGTNPNGLPSNGRASTIVESVESTLQIAVIVVNACRA